MLLWLFLAAQVAVAVTPGGGSRVFGLTAGPEWEGMKPE